MEKNKNNSGQLLLESAIAITVLIVGLLGIFGLLARSFGLNKIITIRYTAAYLAAEGIEIIKNIVDANAVQQISWNQDLSEGFYEVDYNNPPRYLGAITALKDEKKQARFLQFDTKNYLYDYSSTDDSQQTLFQRIVEIRNVFDDKNQLNQIQVNSKVFWKDDLLIDAEDHFFNILGQ